MPLALTTVFADVPDPRIETANKLHPLTDILVIATCAVIAGADGWEEIAEYGRSKETFFRRFLALPHGFPATTRSSACSPNSTRMRSPTGSAGG